MLLRLEIKNFVIVDQLALDFQSGFGTLTGETGAGKSILIDALSLALGDRAEAGVVREGAKRAEIVAEFELPKTADFAVWADEIGVDLSDGVLVLKRQIEEGGRSRLWLNDTAVSQSQLRQISELLADIHGQQAHHGLLKPEVQRDLLDAYAGLEDGVREMTEQYQLWQHGLKTLLNAQSNAEQAIEQRATLEWQVEELKNVLSAEHWANLQQEHTVLSNSEALIQSTENVLTRLDEEPLALLSQLSACRQMLSDAAALDPALADSVSLLDSAIIQLGEARALLRRYLQSSELEPSRLAEIDEQLSQQLQLARKYRIAADALVPLKTELMARLQALEATGDLQKLAQENAAQEKKYYQLAKNISTKRLAAANKLATEVTELMGSLAMPGGKFAIALTAQEASGQGVEHIEFQVAANAGQSLRPLHKAASGGELSRIGLAIQVIASRSGEAQLLIFDEVDVGVGGGVAEIVGQLLARIGDQRQVVCVTHLPQVAAQAAWQWQISKRDSNGQAVSVVHVLDDKGRQEEIARMLGGVEISNTTREHARELLARHAKKKTADVPFN